MPDSLSVALIGLGGHVDGGGDGLRKSLEAAFVAAALGDFVELALGFLDLLRGREIDRGLIGLVDHVLADHDQRAAHRQIVDGAAVILRVDDGGRFRREASEILTERQSADIGIGGQEGLQRDRTCDLAGAHELRRDLVNLLVDRLEEMPRFQKVGNAIERFVVDQDCAQQRLLGLDVMRGGAIERCLVRRKLARGRVQRVPSFQQGVCYQ